MKTAHMASTAPKMLASCRVAWAAPTSCVMSRWIPQLDPRSSADSQAARPTTATAGTIHPTAWRSTATSRLTATREARSTRSRPSQPTIGALSRRSGAATRVTSAAQATNSENVRTRGSRTAARRSSRRVATSQPARTTVAMCSGRMSTAPTATVSRLQKAATTTAHSRTRTVRPAEGWAVAWLESTWLTREDTGQPLVSEPGLGPWTRAWG
jgi:hypothetical protein